jgi:hypothetical protein
MTAAGLIVLSVACLIAAVVGAILVTYLDIRAERKWGHWHEMPGAIDAYEQQGGDLRTLATKWARDDWDDNEPETEKPSQFPRPEMQEIGKGPWSRKA